MKMETYHKIKRSLLPITIIISIILLNGCIVSKPDSVKVYPADYNTRKTVAEPHFHKKLSPIGISVSIGVPLICAYAAYNTSLVTIQNGENRSKIKPANAFIGALVGFSVTSLINHSLGLNKTIPASDPQKWLKVANSNYLVLPNSIQQHQFTAISPSSEFNFAINNIQDVRDFKSVFPVSAEKDVIFKKAIDNCKRADLPELLSLYPESKYKDEAKIAYIERSSTYDELTYAVSKYPEININVEKKLVDFIVNITHAINFITTYPNSDFKKLAVINSFNTSNQALPDITMLRNKYANNFFLESGDEISNSNNEIKRNYSRALYSLRKLSSILELETFYNDYSWLAYFDKSDDIINDYWNIANNTITDGNFILYLLQDIASSSTYREWGVTETAIESFINKQLKDEVKNKLTVKSTYEMGTTNDEWDKWCNNSTYSAGLVSEEGRIQYIIYGELQNNSKFDLPAFIECSSDLFNKSELQGTGTISNIFAKLSNSAGSDETLQKLGSQTNYFYIPSLPSKSTTSYAIMLDYGEGSTRSGVNVMDWVKLKTQTFLANTNLNIHYSNNTPSYSVLREQEKWLYFAKNGLPNATLVDLYRGEAVKNEVWDQKHRDILEARRQAAIAAENRRKIANIMGCYKFEKMVDVSDKYRGYKIECFSSGTKTIYFKDYWRTYDGILGILGDSRILALSKDDPWEIAARKACGCD